MTQKNYTKYQKFGLTKFRHCLIL